MLLRMLILSCFFILRSRCAYADDLFATGWGAAFNSSAEGQLVFTMLAAAGIYFCMKSLHLLYGYHLGKQTQHGNWNCAMRFLAGTFLFYGHETANFIYNSF